MLAQRVLSVLAAAAIAVLTLMPRATRRMSTIFAEGDAIGGEVTSVMPLILVGLAVVVVIGLVWKSRLAARLKMSWPLFGLAALFLLGFAVLVSSTVQGALLGLVSTGTNSWLDRMSAQMDGAHAVAYAGFALIVALAWRDKVGVAWLVLAMFAYGFVLELLQKLVPTREYRLGDLAANGLGIVVGVVVVVLFDLVADARNSRPDRGAQEHRRRRRSSRPARPSPGSKRAGPVVMLAGFVVAFASVLIGSMVELQLTRVGWRILTFSSAYGLAFWFGLLAMAAGWLMISGLPGSRRKRQRLMPPRSARRRVP